MRKCVLAIAFVMVILSGINAQASSFNDKLLLYIPNRALDLADMISVSLGFGPKIKLEGRATRFVDCGAGIGTSASIVKAYNRQYGADIENGWNASFLWIAAEDTEVAKSTRGVNKYWYQFSGVPSYEDRIYNFYEGERDFWELGVNAAALLDVHLGVHPVEVADFFTGLVFIDIKGDDITMETIEE